VKHYNCLFTTIFSFNHQHCISYDVQIYWSSAVDSYPSFPPTDLETVADLPRVKTLTSNDGKVTGNLDGTEMNCHSVQSKMKERKKMDHVA
jgi:hypothetical protein